MKPAFIDDYGGKADGDTANPTNNSPAFAAAFAASREVRMGPGTYAHGAVISVGAGKALIGSGRGVTRLKVLGPGYPNIAAGSNSTQSDFTMVGIRSGGNIESGGWRATSANNVTADNLSVEGANTQGFSLRYCNNVRLGTLFASGCGHRGMNVSALSYDITVDSFIGRDNWLAGWLVGYGCHDVSVGNLILSGGRNAALWVCCNSYRVNIGEAIIGPPEVGYEDNSAVVLGWNVQGTYIGRVTSRGWRRGIQFKSDNVPATGDPKLDPFIANGHTEGNVIGSAFIECDGSANSAGIYFDSHNTRIVKNNQFPALHVKNAQYGVRSVGNNTGNVFGLRTWENVTTPFAGITV